MFLSEKNFRVNNPLHSPLINSAYFLAVPWDLIVDNNSK